MQKNKELLEKGSIRGNKVCDLIAIGGGIIGSGIAREAVPRGLSKALFEKSDYCSGMTARSTRLKYGGLRHLETLDFRLVRFDLAEREILLWIAKHLLRPLPFIVPFYSCNRAYRWKVRLGLYLHDLLSFGSALPRHRSLSRKQIISSEPLLEQQGLQVGFL